MRRCTTASARRAAQGRVQALRVPAGLRAVRRGARREKSQAELKALKELRQWK